MRGKRARQINREARRHKAAKRAIKHRRRFVPLAEEYVDEAPYVIGGGYVDRLTGAEYTGDMPPVLKAFKLTETYVDGERVR